MIGLFLFACFAPPDGDHRDALSRFGAAVLKLGRDELVSAQNQFEAATKADPGAAAPLKALIPVYLDLGRDPAAERAARRVLVLDPEDAETGLALGRMLLATKKPKEAAAVLTKAASSPRLAGDPATAIDLYHELARAAEQSDDLPAAESALSRRLDLLQTKKTPVARSTGRSPEDVDRMTAESWERLGAVRTALRKWDGAASAFERARSVFADPKGVNDPAAAARVHRNLARVADARGDAPAAVKHQAAYLAAMAPGLSPLVDYATYLRKAGRDADAEFERLAGANPRSERLKWVLAAERGRANLAAAAGASQDLIAFTTGTTDPELFAFAASYFAEVGRSEVALDWAETIFKAAKEDATPGSSKAKRMALVAEAIRANRALALGVVFQAASDLRTGKTRSDAAWEFVAWLAHQTGQEEVAGDAAVAAVRSNNRSPEVLVQAFRTYERRREWQKLVEVCDKYLENRGDGKQYFRALVTRAHALAELDLGNQALQTLENAERVDWNNDGKFSLRVQRIRILSILGQYHRAASAAESLLAEQTRPYEVAQVRYVLADAYLGLNRIDKAEVEWRAVLEADPDDVLALNNLGYHLADFGIKLPEAEELIRRAIALDADDRARAGNPVADSGVYLDRLGWVQFRRGKLAEAKATIEKALSFPDGAADPVVWDHYGDVLFKLGEREKAKAAWRKAEPGYATGHQGRQGGRKDELKRKLDLIP